MIRIRKQLLVGVFRRVTRDAEDPDTSLTAIADAQFMRTRLAAAIAIANMVAAIEGALVERTGLAATWESEFALAGNLLTVMRAPMHSGVSLFAAPRRRSSTRQRQRAVPILLGHYKIESAIRYLGVDIEDALNCQSGPLHAGRALEP